MKPLSKASKLKFKAQEEKDSYKNQPYLKSCPFCGAKQRDKDYFCGGAEGPWLSFEDPHWFIQCGGCNATSHLCLDVPILNETGKERAVRIWNTRAKK